jgi:DNA polymerase-1
MINMMQKLRKDVRADYAACVFDAPGKTFRDDLYPEYKANRSPMPPDLRAQIDPIHEVVRLLGWKVLNVPGVEADDVIGTLALRGFDEGLDVIVSTSDKDFAQLVRDPVEGRGIALVNTMSGSRLDSTQRVVEKFGVRPDQIVDFLALMGDSVDNIPGVEKCGPKTAAKWLAEYGTLDGVIANAGAIKGKVGENLARALERLPLNRTLTTIRIDCELELGPTDLGLRARDMDALRELFSRYGLRQALRELEGGAPATGPGISAIGRADAAAPALDPALAAAGEYELVLTQPRLEAWVETLHAADEFAFDTETDSLDALCANLVGLSFCVEPGRACYIPVGHDYPGAPAQLDVGHVLRTLAPLFADASKKKLGQHGKYDIHVLRCHGVDVRGYSDDTMLESFVLNATATRHDMDSLAKKYLGYDTIKYTDVAGKGAKQIRFSQVALDDATRYAAEDADVTLRLHRVLAPKLREIPALERVYRDIEIPLVPVLERIEANGVMIDADELRRQSADLGRRMLELQQRATEVAGRTFNLDSPRQVCALLYDELKLPALVKTPSGGPSANEEALEAIADQHELPRLILDYRGLAKLRGTYTDKLPEMLNPRSGRLHTSFHQAGAATGRLASSDPNLQNIPIRTGDGRRIRTAFVAPEGRRIVACDYSQIELRIMAHLSEDPALLRAFTSNVDVHTATAAEVFGKTIDAVEPGERRAAKAINFGLMYGMSAFGLAARLGIPRGEAQDYIALYFARYPGVREYMERTRQQARDQGYVETVFGRRLYLENIHARNQGLRSGAERAAINAPMQGTAADIIKRAMIDIHGWLEAHAARALMVLQVHDELVFEVDQDFVPELVDEVRQRMASAAELKVPLEVEAGVGLNWDQAH